MKAIKSLSLALGVASMTLIASAYAGVGGPPNMPALNLGSGGISVIGMPGSPAPYWNLGSGGISVIGMPGAPAPYWNLGSGGISVIGMPGSPSPYFNLGSGGISVIGMPGANGQMVPVQNAGGNGGFVAVPPPPAPPQPVLCKLRDQVLIAGAVESCEKAGGKAITPEASAK